MKRFLLLLPLIFFFAFPVFADDPAPGCVAIYQVPDGQPYNYRDASIPPIWKTNRWMCLESGVGFTEFENSPSDGMTTDYYLALRFDTANGVVFYPVLYVNENKLHIWEFTPSAQNELTGWTAEQGTGKVSLASAPGVGNGVLFEIH